MRLEAGLRGLGSVLVAFSGGADSAFLLAAAVRTLGADNVLAATAVSASLPSTELEAARAFAASRGVRHLTPVTDASHGKVVGDFTFLGQTKPLTLDVELIGAGPGGRGANIGISAKGKLNPADYALTLAGPGMVELQIDAELNRQNPRPDRVQIPLFSGRRSTGSAAVFIWPN